MCPFRRKMVRRRLNALGFSIQLPKFVENPAEDLESEVCAYLASINSCTITVFRPFRLGLSRKSPETPTTPPAHAKVRRRAYCGAGRARLVEELPPTTIVMASRPRCGWVRKKILILFLTLGAPVVVEANQRSSMAMGGLDAGYVRVGEPVGDDE
jgi:hypothetical protein